jgi:hypothetical protein
MELKWILAVALEAGFWIMLAAFLVLRYRYGMEGVTGLFVIGVVLDTAGLLALGVWDFAATGNVSAYTLFIAGLLLYALTAGKRDLKRLDAWMARRLTPRGRRARPAWAESGVFTGGRGRGGSENPTQVAKCSRADLAKP